MPGKPDWGYYGRGGHVENDVRPITYATMVNAFLAEVHPPDDTLGEGDRARYRRDAVAALRYLVDSHKIGPGNCLNGKPWGDQWQSAMWARAAGMAGWMLWGHLDRQMKVSVVRLVEHEADRFLDTSPKSSEFRDTGAEENAWNSMHLALAATMMPDHPRAARWDEAARRYMYNSLSVAADQDDETPGDFDRPINKWVRTVNAHPDFTVENHSLVHIGYLKTTLAMLMESGTHYMIAGRPIPGACFHHVDEGLDVVLHSMAWDGSPVFFGGNDWKIVHSQATDVLLYAVLNVAGNDRRAAHLESTALDWLGRMQEQEDGFYNVRRDLEYGGLCATRLIASYLAHAAGGGAARPVLADEFDQSVSGVTELEFAQAILHRTPTKFASFSWGPKRMALALPRDGNWVLWPHFASHLGNIDGKDASRKNAKLAALKKEVVQDSFCVAARLERSGGRVVQDVAFASPPGDVTVYVERLTIAAGFELSDRQTGIIGHEFELDSNERVIHGRFGTARIVGLGGEEKVHQWPTDWLNLGNRVGYVICRQPGRENFVRYHDLTKGSGRVPKLQEWISLIGDPDPCEWDTSTDWACLVTFLNQPADRTAAWAPRVRFEVDGQTAVCRVGKEVFHVDFAGTSARLERVTTD